MSPRFDTLAILALTACLIGVGDLAYQGPRWIWFIAVVFTLPTVARVLRESWDARPHIDRALKAADPARHLIVTELDRRRAWDRFINQAAHDRRQRA